MHVLMSKQQDKADERVCNEAEISLIGRIPIVLFGIFKSRWLQQSDERVSDSFVTLSTKS